MITVPGKISFADALLKVRMRAYLAGVEVPSYRDSALLLRAIALEVGGSELVGPRGERISVGEQFLFSAIPPRVTDGWIGWDGLIKRHDIFFKSRATEKITFWLFGLAAFVVVISHILRAVEKFLAPGSAPWHSTSNATESQLLLLFSIAGFAAFVWTFWLEKLSKLHTIHSLPDNWVGLVLVFDEEAVRLAVDGTAPDPLKKADSAPPVEGNQEPPSSLKHTVAAEKRATEFIIKQFEDGEPFTKADMEALLTSSSGSPALSRRGFLRAWDAARAIIPEIGRSGRRPGKSNPRSDTED